MPGRGVLSATTAEAWNVAHPHTPIPYTNCSWYLRAPRPLASCLPGVDTLVSSFLEGITIPTLRVLFCKLGVLTAGPIGTSGPRGSPHTAVCWPESLARPQDPAWA